MKLQPNDVSLPLKRPDSRIQGSVRAGPHLEDGQRFPMPMEYSALRRKAERRLTLVHSLNRKPSDFLNRITIHPRIQGARQ